MSKNQTPKISLTEHIGNIVFDKKVDSSISTDYNLEEQIVLFSNKVLGVQVQSVVLPPNYLPQPKTEAEVMDWLRNKIQNRHSFAYSMSLKYGEKVKIKLDKKNLTTNKKKLKMNQDTIRTTKLGQVKKHLITKGSIDSWTAINQYGATRLSAIIFNLRRAGLIIVSQPSTVKDRNGNLCNFVTYKFIEKNQ